ncbi:MAG: VOC family protein [Candidatus Dormibacteraceae bacterium]
MIENGEGPITQLAEVVLWVRNPQLALGFYRDLLGLQVMSPPELATIFLRVRTGAVPHMIVLVPHPDPDGQFPSSKKDRVLHHLAFGVDGKRYEDLCHSLRQHGLEVRSGIHPVLKGVRTAYVDDPDGNEVELIAPD